MNETEKESVLRRLRNVQGHMAGIVRMVEADAYCVDLIHQIQAVESSLDKVSEMILESHLHTCLVTAVRGEDDEGREQALREIVGVFRARRRA